MKSKISFFNKTIFLKNVTLYWPIWAVYTILLLFGLPIPLWFEMQYDYGDRLSTSQMIRELSSYIAPQYYTVIISFTAVAVGMAMFGYLYKSQSANMIHSLPVDRTQLYGTNVISGLVFLMVPLLLTYVLTVLVCVNEGITCVEYVGIWLLVSMATAVIAFGIVTFCAFLTGLMVALPIYVVIANLLVMAVIGVIELMMNIYAYGVGYSSLITDHLLIWFSPFLCFFRKVQFERIYENDALVGLDLQGVSCILIYLALAIVLYGLAYWIYQRRKIESAGEIITVEFVKPIFRWGVGTLAGFYIMIFLYAIFGEIGMRFSMPVVILVLLFFGAVFFFVADMFIRKNFRVFDKRNWKRCGVFAVTLLISFFALYFYADIEEKRMPNAKDVVSVEISQNYSVYFEEKDIEQAIVLHKQILEHVDECEQFELSRYYNHADVTWKWVNIDYTLQDGSYMTRSYMVPETATTKPILDVIEEWESRPEVMLTDILGRDYKNVEAFITGHLYMEIYTHKESEEDILAGNITIDSVNQELTASQCRKLYDAILLEATEGELFKYNGHNGYENDKNEMVYMVQLEYYLKGKNNNYSNYARVAFGRDCQYIIDAILDLEIAGVDSADDIVWIYE